MCITLPYFLLPSHDLGAFCENLTVAFCEAAKEDEDEERLLTG